MCPSSYLGAKLICFKGVNLTFLFARRGAGGGRGGKPPLNIRIPWPMFCSPSPPHRILGFTCTCSPCRCRILYHAIRLVSTRYRYPECTDGLIWTRWWLASGFMTRDFKFFQNPDTFKWGKWPKIVQNCDVWPFRSCKHSWTDNHRNA